MNTGPLNFMDAFNHIGVSKVLSIGFELNVFPSVMAHA